MPSFDEYPLLLIEEFRQIYQVVGVSPGRIDLVHEHSPLGSDIQIERHHDTLNEFLDEHPRPGFVSVFDVGSLVRFGLIPSHRVTASGESSIVGDLPRIPLLGAFTVRMG